MADAVSSAPGPSLAAALLAASPDGVLAFDRAYRITAWNPAMERISGLAAEAVLGRVQYDLFPWLREVGEPELAARALAGEESVSSGWPFRVEATGRAGWVETRYAPLRGEGGEVVGVVGVVRDVTAARRAEAALRESEARFRALADTAPVLIWVADTRNLGTYFNRPWLEFTGRTLAEELGAGWLSSIHPEDAPRAAEFCQRHFAERREFRMEFRLRRADGEYRWVLDHGVPRWGADGEFLGYVGSCIDITDRRAAEEALRREEARYRSLVEASTETVWRGGPGGEPFDASAWHAVTGQTLEASLDGGWMEAVHPDDRPRVAEEWARAHATASVYEVEYRMRTAGGAYRWVAVRGVPVRDEGGVVREWVGTFNDVHARRAAEAALRESEERYRLATRATRDLVWDWSLADGALRWNEAVEEVLGYAPEAVGGTIDWWYEHIHPDDRERVVGGVHEVVERGGEGWSGEYRFLRADGSWAVMFDRGYLLRGQDGRPTRMVGAMQDVTERRRLERAREDERERLRRVLSQMPAAVAVYEGPDHVFVAMSDRYHRIIGRREAMGRPLREAIPELAAQGFDDLLSRVYRTGEPYVGMGMRADWDDDGDGVVEEHVVDFVYEPLTDAGGRVYGVVAHVTDVTARHRAERQVAEARAEAELRAAEAARLAAELSENAAQLLEQYESSRLLAERLALANEELLAASERAEGARRRLEALAFAGSRLAASLDVRETVRTVAGLMAPALADWCFVEVQDEPGGPVRLLAAGHADPEKVQLAFDILSRFPIRLEDDFGTAKVLRTGEPELVADIPPGVFEAVAHDGEHLRILREIGFRASLGVPLRAGGRTFGVLTLVQGESGRRFGDDDLRLAQELAQRAALAIENARLYEEALAANRAKAGFLATMSHELRTPLNAMIGYVDLLLLGIPAPIPEAARAQVERIRLASRHLLSIIEEILTFSRLEAGRETVEAEEVDLGAVVREASAIIEPLAAARGIAFVVPDAEGLPPLVTDPRKLRQILVNLLGNAVKFTHEGSVTFAVERRDGSVLLHVRDTGIGVEARDLEIIFEAFRQVDDAKTRSASGTGLGLAVSRRLARLLGGDVTVESTPGVGSTFTVTLPEEGA